MSFHVLSKVKPCEIGDRGENIDEKKNHPPE